MAVNLLHKLPLTYSENGIQYYTRNNKQVNSGKYLTKSNKHQINNMSNNEGLSDVNRINEGNISNKIMTLKEKFSLILMQFWASDWEGQCEKVTDEFAIGFAEWLLIIYNEDIIYDAYSKEELLEIYKKEIRL